MEAVLFQVRADDVDEVLGRLSVFRSGSGASGRVVADGPLHHLRPQAVPRPPPRGEQAQHIAAFRFAIQGTRQGVDLSTNAGHSIRQFLLLADRVRHVDQYTLVVYRMIPGWPISKRIGSFWE